MLSHARAPLRWGDDPLGDFGGASDATQQFSQLDLATGDRQLGSSSSSSRGGGLVAGLSPPGLQGKVDALQNGLSRRYRPDLRPQNQLALLPHAHAPLALEAPTGSGSPRAAASSGAGETSAAGLRGALRLAPSAPGGKPSGAAAPPSSAPRALALQAALKGASAYAEPVKSHVVIE